MFLPQSLQPIDALCLLLTSFIAGGINAVAGGGTFITFPTLIFTGLSPIAANATNNTALWIASIASAGAYRRALNIPKQQLGLFMITSLIGGWVGALLLLYTASSTFEKLIPYLLLSATLLFTFGDKIKQKFQLQNGDALSIPILNLLLAQFTISVYGGFFGAGLGILMLATLAFLGIKNIHSINALKTLLGGCINGIAIVPFIQAGAIAWHETVLMAIAASLGGYLTAHYAQKLDPQWIRRFVIVVGFTMSIYFFVRR